NQLREQIGMSASAQLAVEKIKRMKSWKRRKAVVVNGVRSPAEIKEFKRNFKFKLIALKAPIELRFKRILRRGRRDDPKRFQDFMWSERMERKWGLAKTVESADYSVKNEGKKSEAVAKLKSIMRRLAH
ncbi:dephospho-CoA kinase, partial [Candidatus Micrarchaeota archaeon]